MKRLLILLCSVFMLIPAITNTHGGFGGGGFHGGGHGGWGHGGWGHGGGWDGAGFWAPFGIDAGIGLAAGAAADDYDYDNYDDYEDYDND